MSLHAPRASLALIVPCLAGLAAPLRGQPLEWYLDPFIADTVRIQGSGFADDLIDADSDFVSNMRNIWTPGAPYAMGFLTYGTSYSVSFDETALDTTIVPSYAEAETFPYVMMYGYGTDTIEVVWFALTAVDTDSPIAADAIAENSVRFSLDLSLANINPTTPVEIVYQYELFSRTMTAHEGAGEDPVYVRQANLIVDGVNLTGDRFDINYPGGPNNISAQREYRSPAIVKTTTAGNGIQIEVQGFVESQIHSPAFDRDSAWALWKGRIRLKAQPPGGAVEDLLPPTELQGGYIDFSVDIGSDTELSAGPPDGDEMFDPGDIYAWHGSPAPPGVNGYRNDATWFSSGADPFPSPSPGSIPAPVCSGTPPSQLPPDWFDLDAHDTLDFPLTDLIPAGSVPTDPIAAFDSLCIYSAQYLIASFDDDWAGHYAGCTTPTMTSSPWGARYGTTGGRDELVGVTTSLLLGSAVQVTSVYPLLDEAGLHGGLAPNPDLSEIDDDDVDSVDVLPDDGCDHLLFSVDHETPTPRNAVVRATLDPGSIYAPAPPSPGAEPVLVVSGGLHLGLAPGTDLNAIEFVWTWTTLGSGTAGGALTLLFTVDIDDPGTASDESGGLDPRMIYASYLTGNSFPFLSAPLPDVIDALAAWQHELRSASGSRADVNCDGTVDFFDIDPFLQALFDPAGYVAAHPNCTLQTADVNGDGVIDFFDIDVFLACLFGTCP